MNFILISLILSLTACASIITGSNPKVSIDSYPINASFSVYNKSGEFIQAGQTPESIHLKSNDGFFSGEKYTVKYSKSGYEDSISIIDHSLNPWYFGNIVLGGFIGMLIVDPLTGSMWTLHDSTAGSLDRK